MERIVGLVMDHLTANNDDLITVNSVANAVYNQLDPDNAAPATVKWLTVATLRETAAEGLIAAYEPGLKNPDERVRELLSGGSYKPNRH
jgi:hypothetical protein